MRRVNPFDWKAEFSEIMKAGGFDAVIGNPPYVRQESLSVFKEYLAQRYEAYDGVADLYAYFMEKSVKLLREGGRFSFIVSSSFLRTTYGDGLAPNAQETCSRAPHSGFRRDASVRERERHLCLHSASGENEAAFTYRSLAHSFAGLCESRRQRD